MCSVGVVTVCVIIFQPAVSVGNVGQLAVDLIISTLDMVRVGHFHTDCLIPMVGNNPYSRSEKEEKEALLSTNAEGRVKTTLGNNRHHTPGEFESGESGQWKGMNKK